MSDELHDYSEIYTPTGNDDERLRQLPGVVASSWVACNDATNNAHGGGIAVGTGTNTTNTSCR